jgi:STAS domain
LAAPGTDAPQSTREKGADPPSRSIVVFVRASIGPTAIPLMCARVHAFLVMVCAEGVMCDMGAVTAPDVGVVDVLARLHLTAQRLGRPIRLRRVGADLEQLLVFVGLNDLVGWT